MGWRDEFLPYMAATWEPGEHVAYIATTGSGKTTTLAQLSTYCRRYVLLLDPKGGDKTLTATGLERLDRWPGVDAMTRRVQRDVDNETESHYIVGAASRSPDAITKLTGTLKAALDDAYAMGGWTVNADELQLLTDTSLHNLKAECNRTLVAARDSGLSFVSAFQSPAWVPSHAHRQATWVMVSYTRDRDTVRRLSEILGRPRDELELVMSELPPFGLVMVSRNPREPYVLTVPDPIE